MGSVPRRLRRGWRLRRLPWLNRQQAAEDVALARRVFSTEASRVEDGRALVGRQGAQGVKGAAELPFAGRGHALECLSRGADFLPALG